MCHQRIDRHICGHWIMGAYVYCTSPWLHIDQTVQFIDTPVFTPCSACSISRPQGSTPGPTYRNPFMSYPQVQTLPYRITPIYPQPQTPPQMIAGRNGVPTFPQQIPGPGSYGQHLLIPSGMVQQQRYELHKGVVCPVMHYAWPNATRGHSNHYRGRGLNTLHGPDPGDLPPGWGEYIGPSGGGGWNSAYGRDPGSLPSGWFNPEADPVYLGQQPNAYFDLAERGLSTATSSTQSITIPEPSRGALTDQSASSASSDNCSTAAQNGSGVLMTEASPESGGNRPISCADPYASELVSRGTAASPVDANKEESQALVLFTPSAGFGRAGTNQ